MTNPRQDKQSQDKQNQDKQNFESSIEEATRKMNQESTRATRNIADMSERAARANVEMFHDNMEMARWFWQMEIARCFWQSTADLSSSITTRSADHFGRALGLTGDEAQMASRQSSRNLGVILQSNEHLSRGMSKISAECLVFLQSSIERWMDQWERLLRSRTPQEFAAVQTDVVREQLAGAIDGTRRVAQISVQAADEATRKLKENFELARSAA